MTVFREPERRGSWSPGQSAGIQVSGAMEPSSQGRVSGWLLGSPPLEEPRWPHFSPLLTQIWTRWRHLNLLFPQPRRYRPNQLFPYTIAFPGMSTHLCQLHLVKMLRRSEKWKRPMGVGTPGKVKGGKMQDHVGRASDHS